MDKITLYKNVFTRDISKDFILEFIESYITEFQIQEQIKDIKFYKNPHSKECFSYSISSQTLYLDLESCLKKLYNLDNYDLYRTIVFVLLHEISHAVQLKKTSDFNLNLFNLLTNKVNYEQIILYLSLGIQKSKNNNFYNLYHPLFPHEHEADVKASILSSQLFDEMVFERELNNISIAKSIFEGYEDNTSPFEKIVTNAKIIEKYDLDYFLKSINSLTIKERLSLGLPVDKSLIEEIKAIKDKKSKTDIQKIIKLD